MNFGTVQNIKRSKKRKYVHKQSKMESQTNAAYIKKKNKNAIDMNITQMMVGKQWVKR